MVREVVTRYLRREGFDVITAADGAEALEVIASSQPDVVVLDLMLPSVSGLEVLGSLRRHSAVPVILLTARGEESDRVLGLELGADDYVTKPFSARELAARVKSVLRRSVTPPEPVAAVLTFDDLTIDARARQVTVRGDIVDLTRREFELLVFLAGSPGQVFSRRQLLDHVWDSSPEWQDPSTVTVHVRRLRTKLGDGVPPIATVWGVGYRFEA
ncbi:MAG: response regulator transcription factor [Acidimicrobiia bacterium]|nr:response regulator transcription factor [Acidimicrobiia bacterium]MBT8194339.1 response regulator transcription factor [Acidimicrobiia bacterium]RZV46770.1 MAG: response regulator transcription factor [Acidimicrobiia bacterium]